MDFPFHSIPYDGFVPVVPKHSGVYKIFDTQGKLIVLDKTSNLHERLERFFGSRSELLRDLDLRKITSRVEYIRTESPFETLYVLYRERRRYFPKTYRRMRTFRMFTLVKINRRQRFPRIYISRQIKTGVDYFGPIVSRTQFTRLKTTLERTFKLRPCLYNIRGNDPHPDCLYFQMHTCSRPCNNDLDRAGYLEDVHQAIAFIQGFDNELMEPLIARMKLLAEEVRFEEAEALRRRLDKIQRARQEVKETFFSIWSFNFIALLPADSVTRCKIVFVRQGHITGFETYDVESLGEILPGDLQRFFGTPSATGSSESQYDEFCLVSNFIVDPVQSVDLIPAAEIDDLTRQILERIQQRNRKRKRDRAADNTDDAD
jgi:excinuclease UvrABC nuclease subunit